MNNPWTGMRFHWGVVFCRDVNSDKPFNIFPFESLPEVPKTWIECSLPSSFRHKGLNLQVTGKISCLFAKIEYGKKRCLNLRKLPVYSNNKFVIVMIREGGSHTFIHVILFLHIYHYCVYWRFVTCKLVS